VTLGDMLLESAGPAGVTAVRKLLERQGIEVSVRDYLTTALQEAGATAPQSDI